MEISLDTQKPSTRFVSTTMGEIAVYTSGPATGTPLVMLHGVYYNHHLWDSIVANLTDQPILRIDMPGHGASKGGTPKEWTLVDCATMLLEVLDALEIPQAIGIGHSWGSMTLLRAAHRAPERFAALGLSNMPFLAGTPRTQWQFRMQHLLLPFRGFYERQVAKAMYGTAHRITQPNLTWLLTQSMRKVTARNIRQTDRAVIMYATDATAWVETLLVPALALKGEEDYVPVPPKLATTLVPGGHVSPLEVPEQVTQWIHKVIALSHR
ncbi:MAG: alpha/beta hydrolase [Bacteroidota bacterium]